MTSFLIRTLSALLFLAFGTVAAFAVPGDWTSASYPVVAQEVRVQPVSLTNTARALPTASANVMATGTAFAQTGNLRALNGLETTGAVYAFLRSSIAPKGGRDSFLDGSTASGDSVYHGNYSTAIGDDAATVNNFNNAINTGNGHNVIVHGQLDYDDLGGIPTVNGRETNPAQISDAVKSNPNYVEGSQVCFASCWSGSSGSAQQLANELGAPVFAPSRPVAWDSQTDDWVFDTDVFPSGVNLPRPDIQPGWQTFHPLGD